MSATNDNKPLIREAIIVEGRDDAAVVTQAVEALVITTHGFGISRGTWELIDKAHDELGIIVLTDPDHAGEGIRKRITDRYPDAKQAFISRRRATKDGDIGVENATPEDVLEALEKAHVDLTALPGSGRFSEGRASEGGENREEVDADLLRTLGLVGRPDSAALREHVGSALGIGYGNGKAILKKLRAFGITAEELRREVSNYKSETKE